VAMKKIRLLCGAAFAALPLLAVTVKTDGIKGIAKPFTGTYRAEKVLWGKDEVTGLLKDLTIELTPEGDINLTYKQGLKTQTHNFSYKVEDGKLFVGLEEGAVEGWREAKYEKGKIYLTMPLGQKTLNAVFSR